MNKYQVCVTFYVDEGFMSLVPEHRKVINALINRNIIDSYAISAETGRGWITMNGHTKQDVINHLKKSPLFERLQIEIDELFVYDSQMYRFPKIMMN
jgi:hypothetical protein